MRWADAGPRLERGVGGSDRRNDPARRVLHLFGQMLRGGAELRTVEVMRHLNHAAYHLEYLSLSGLPGTLDAEIAALGGVVHHCRLGPRFPWAFSRLLRLRRFDVVHSHVHYFSGFLLRLAHRAGVPTRVAHFRSTDDDHQPSLRRRMQRAAMRHFIDRYATDIVAVSEAAMTAGWGAGWRCDPRCVVVYNGLDVASFRQPPERSRVREEFGFPSDARVWIHVGRIDRSKNHQRLLRVFARHKQRGASDRLLLVGRATEERKWSLHREAARLGLRDCVVMTGERRDVARLLQASDIMVYPSIREGLPGAVLEACAVGLPVLGSDIAGIQEIARHCASVRCLSLEASDVEWVRAAEGMLSISELRPDDSWRTAIADFERGPFSIGRCTQQLCSIWDKSSEGGIPHAQDLPPQRPSVA